jgi:bacterioferritin-associated ferredoxin
VGRRRSRAQLVQLLLRRRAQTVRDQARWRRMVAAVGQGARCGLRCLMAVREAMRELLRALKQRQRSG